MAGTFTIKALGNGQLPSSVGALYTVPAATHTVIKVVTLTNTDASTKNVNLYISTDGGSTHRRVIPKDIGLGAGYTLIFDAVLTLEATHLLEGDATSASVVDYTISGIEET